MVRQAHHERIKLTISGSGSPLADHVQDERILLADIVADRLRNMVVDIVADMVVGADFAPVCNQPVA